MNTAWEHDRSCDASCSVCKSDWECPYMGIACQEPRDKHICPKCESSTFRCHPLSDGHPYNGKTIGWCAVGGGWLFIAPYMTEAQDKALKMFPGVRFVESNSLHPVELEALRTRLKS